MNELYSEIKAATDQISAQLIETRHHLHRHPELGRVEFETSKYLRNRLESVNGFEFHTVGETGFCADLITERNGPWLVWRADMDALPIPDEKDVPYKSVNTGISHACGHDFHSTVALGIAVVLGGLRDKLAGNIRFIFQHAEEPIPGGAIDFVNAGYLDQMKAIFGLHADPGLPVGKIGISSGWMTAQSIHFKISITGTGGHSARPNESADPIFAGMIVLKDLYAGLYRKLDNLSPFVFTVGKITAGDNYNSIAKNFIAEGTLRVTDPDQSDTLLDMIRLNLINACDIYGLTPDFFYRKGTPPVINDLKLTEMSREILHQILNTDQLVEAKRSMGGEDFSSFLEKVPGVFFRVGVGNEKISAPIHTSLFDIDEQSITFSVKTFSWLLIKLIAINRS